MHFTALTGSETALGSSRKPGIGGEALSGGFSQRKPLFPNIHRQLFASVLNGHQETEKMFLNPRPTCTSRCSACTAGGSDSCPDAGVPLSTQEVWFPLPDTHSSLGTVFLLGNPNPSP